MRRTVYSERAQLFYTLEEDGLLVWIQEMGLNRYAQGIIRHAPSGADLVKLVTSHHEHVSISIFVVVYACLSACTVCLCVHVHTMCSILYYYHYTQLTGITHPLHKKKLQLAIRVS